MADITKKVGWKINEDDFQKGEIVIGMDGWGYRKVTKGNWIKMDIAWCAMLRGFECEGFCDDNEIENCGLRIGNTQVQEGIM